MLARNSPPEWIDASASRRELQAIDAWNWLERSAVISRIVPQQKQWAIRLVWINPTRPFQFLEKQIHLLPHPTKAKAYAEAYLRTTHRDPRGNPHVHHASFHICLH